VVTRQLQVKQVTGKVRRSETGILPLCNAAKRGYSKDLNININIVHTSSN